MSVNILKERIEKMSKYHQVEVLRILTNTPEVKINENNKEQIKNYMKILCQIARAYTNIILQART